MAGYVFMGYALSFNIPCVTSHNKLGTLSRAI